MAVDRSEAGGAHHRRSRPALQASAAERRRGRAPLLAPIALPAPAAPPVQRWDRSEATAGRAGGALRVHDGSGEIRGGSVLVERKGSGGVHVAGVTGDLVVDRRYRRAISYSDVRGRVQVH